MKVQVTLNDELVKAIDEFVKYVGTNRSSVCALAIGQYVKDFITPKQSKNE